MQHDTTMKGRETPHFWGTVHLPVPYRVQTVVKTYIFQSSKDLLLCYRSSMKYFSFRSFNHEHHCCFSSGSRRYCSWAAVVYIVRERQAFCAWGCATRMQLLCLGSGCTRRVKNVPRLGLWAEESGT